MLAPCNKGGQGEIGLFPNNISKIATKTRREIVGAIKNVGHGSCYALYFIVANKE